MTAKQHAQRDSYTSFLLTVDANDAIALTAPAFYRSIQTLRSLLVKAQLADTSAQEDTTGITADKNQIKAELYDKMVDLTDIVSGFAAEKNNSTLSKRVNNFASVFGNTRQYDIVPLCKDILDKVKTYLPELADYGITQETLDEITLFMATYEEKVPETRAKRKGKTVSTADRDTLFDEMDDLMTNKILKFSKVFKKTNLAFYNKLTASSTVDETQMKPTLIRVTFRTNTGKRAVHTLTALLEGDDVHNTPNVKGDIFVKVPKGGLHNIKIPIEGSEPINLIGIRAKKGRMVTVKVVI